MLTFRTLVAIAALGFTAACTRTLNQGNEFSMATADSFQPGVTTLKEAIDALGTPESTQAAPNGGRRVAWQYVKAAGTGTSITSKREGIAIVFNADGVMDHVEKRLQTTGKMN